MWNGAGSLSKKAISKQGNRLQLQVSGKKFDCNTILRMRRQSMNDKRMLRRVIYTLAFALLVAASMSGHITTYYTTKILAQAQPTATATRPVSIGRGIITMTAQLWATDFCTGGQVCDVGDFNGDGKDDAVAFSPLAPEVGAGTVFVRLSDGNQLTEQQVWGVDFCAQAPTCIAGDVNGDGYADVIAFTRDDASDPARHGEVNVALSDGTKFVNQPAPWSTNFCRGSEICLVGDLNGDKYADLVAFDRNTGDVYVAFSTSSAFGARQRITQAIEAGRGRFCAGNDTCALGDVDGDGREDLVAFSAGIIKVSRSEGGDFSAFEVLKTQQPFCEGTEDVCLVGDVTGDGKADAVSIRRGRGLVVLPLSVPNGAAILMPSGSFCIAGAQCLIGDFDGLFGDDLIDFRRDSGLAGPLGAVFVQRLFGGGPRFQPRR
jgi:hypothetical protein